MKTWNDRYRRACLIGACASLSVAIAALASCSAVAQPLPPFGYDIFCSKHRDKCHVPEQVMPASKLYKFRDMAEHFNSVFVRVKDTGQIDDWEISDSGDCEDFALTLREKIAAKYPQYRGALRMASAYDEHGDYHAVLVAKTDHGDVVYDVRHLKPMDKAALPYKWVWQE